MRLTSGLGSDVPAHERTSTLEVSTARQQPAPDHQPASPGRRVASHRMPAVPHRRRRPRRRRFSDGLLGLELTLLVMLTGGSAAHADTTSIVAVAASIGVVIDNIQNWILGFLVALATMFLTLGGARYIAAGGDPSQVEKAKTAFKSAAFGYCLAAASPLVMSILKMIVGA